MPRLFSNEPTALAYDGAPSEANVLPDDLKGHRVVINPGINELSDKDVALLQADQHANRAVQAGILVPVDDEGRGQPVTDEPAAAPTKKGKLAKVADVPAEAAKERDDFLALSADEQEAMYPALSEAGKAAVDAARGSK